MNLPAFPKPLARLASALPARPPSLAFAAICNRAAWPVLRHLDWSPVQGRCVCLHLRDLGLRLHFSVRGTGFRAENGHHADVTFTASVEDFARLALRLEDPDTLFFKRRLLIEGDTDLGLTMKNMLDCIEIDPLARLLPEWIAPAAQSWRERLQAKF